MPRRALSEHRPYLLLSLLAGISYFFVADSAIGGAWLMVWKGAAVAFLAVYAARRSAGPDGALIAAAMALGAIGDVAIEIDLIAGGAAFALGHLVAITLYLRNMRRVRTGSQNAAALALAVFAPLIAWLITRTDPDWEIATGYAALLGLMAATAWLSRFPRYRVGLGAVLFIVSDLVLLGRESGGLDPAIAGWLVWPLYYAAQFLIVTGVVQTLRLKQTTG
ncbi:MAG: lysoplasmalogenase [Alphaproteobacteria bacterium]|nr:lysoplasmalogenase [Alphaproteobacteria bacterium]